MTGSAPARPAHPEDLTPRHLTTGHPTAQATGHPTAQATRRPDTPTPPPELTRPAGADRGRSSRPGPADTAAVTALAAAAGFSVVGITPRGRLLVRPQRPDAWPHLPLLAARVAQRWADVEVLPADIAARATGRSDLAHATPLPRPAHAAANTG